MEHDVIVESWGHLQDELFRDTWNDSIQRFRAPFVYRGLSDHAYRLDTTLMRLGGPFTMLERHMLRNFRKYSHHASTHFRSLWHLLAMAQHHGLPTRMLDWTYSPYVALHFAIANHEKYDRDGVIWVVNYQRVHNRLPEPLRRPLDIEGAQAFTVELLANLNPCYHGHPTSEDSTFYDIIRSLEEFDALGAEQDFLLFFEPPSLDERIVNQYALFSVLSNAAHAIDDWLWQYPDLYRRIIIPCDLKWEFRDKLDMCNVTERVLFPGLDGLSSWLKRQYSPKAHTSPHDAQPIRELTTDEPLPTR